MKTILAACTALLCAACAGGAVRAGKPSAETPPPPTEYTYRVVASYPRPADRYTQGLLYADGALWEGTGEYGRSRLLRTDLATGRTETLAHLPREQFGEGIALHDGRIYQLTWQENTAHVYDAATGRPVATHRYAGEGWGLTCDGSRLYLSDGSATIRRIDPATFRREGSVTVTVAGEPVPYLNELEWIDGKIWANVYTTDRIVIVDPATGAVEGIVDLAGLLPAEKRGPATDVLNGIAYDAATGRIFVTGKNWPEIYQIEILKK